MKTITMFTDGACSGNPGPGGIGIVLEYNGKTREISQGYYETTNNRMELRAVIEGLAALKEACRVNLLSDSMYVINGISSVETWAMKGWKNSSGKVKNRDLWEQIRSLISIHTVKPVWVKGHAGNTGNERCDQLAQFGVKNPTVEDVKTSDEFTPDLFAA